MKRMAVMLALCVLVGMAAGGSYYATATRETRTLLSRPGGEMEWLRREYHLSDAQFAQVQAAHAAYRPRCDALCERVANAHAKLKQLMEEGKGVTPEMRAALAESAGVELDCREAMLEHIQTVSNYMDAGSAARFRRMMEERMLEQGGRGEMMFEE